MILDVENNYNSLRISYINPDGKVSIKSFDLPDQKTWAICPDSDRAKDPIKKNWDGRSVKRVSSKKMNKWDFSEFIENLPDEDKKELTALNFPKIQSIDIETEVIDGFPDVNVAREKITCIAIAQEDNSVLVLGWKQLSKQQEKKIFDGVRSYLKDFGEWNFKYVYFPDEFNMLFTFISKILPKCTVATGWNFLDFDWAYIVTRCTKLGIDVSMASPVGKLQYKTNIPFHVGMFDYLQVYKKIPNSIQIKESNKLDFVANGFLGVTKLHYHGSLQELYENDYDTYVMYNAIDACLVTLIHMKTRLLNALISQANKCNVSIYTAYSPINLTERLLWKGFWDRNLVVADVKQQNTGSTQFEGAYVRDPIKGIHRGVACYDYASLYPSIMRQFNISPESFIEKTGSNDKLSIYKNDENVIVTASNAVYDTKKDSVLKEILTSLYAERKWNKARYLSIEVKLNELKNK